MIDQVSVVIFYPIKKLYFLSFISVASEDKELCYVADFLPVFCMFLTVLILPPSPWRKIWFRAWKHPAIQLHSYQISRGFLQIILFFLTQKEKVASILAV